MDLEVKKNINGKADAANAAGEKFSEIDEALSNEKENLHIGINQNADDIRSILDILESDEREKLFGLADEITIKDDLNDGQKLYLMSLLYSLVGTMQQITDNQKRYLRAIYAYFHIHKPVQVIDIFNVSEIETKDESKILFMVINEFLYLGFQNWAYLEDEEFVDFSDSFNLNRRDKSGVIDAIRHKVEIMGIEALVLPYETTNLKKTEEAKAVQGNRQIPDEYVWPDRETRIKFVVEKLENIFKGRNFRGWRMLVDPEEVVTNYVNEYIEDAVALLVADSGVGVVIRQSGLTLFSADDENAGFLPFDGIVKFDSVFRDRNVLLLQSYDGTFVSVKIPTRIEREDSENDSSTGTIDIVLFYSLVFAFIKRGPFYIGDLDLSIYDKYSESTIRDDWYLITDSLNLQDALGSAEVFWEDEYVDERGLAYYNLHFGDDNRIFDDGWIVYPGLKVIDDTLLTRWGEAYELNVGDIVQITFYVDTKRKGRTKNYVYKFKANLKNSESVLIQKTTNDRVSDPTKLAEALNKAMVILK